LEGTVRDLLDLGPVVEATVICGQWPLRVSTGKREFRGLACAPGSRVFLAIDPDDVHVMEK
jgi:hypothetical protein